MENRLFKFMRAKYTEGVKAGKVRGSKAEYIEYKGWKIELNLIFESWSLVAPNRQTTGDMEIIDLVLKAMEAGDTTEIDRIFIAVTTKRFEITDRDGKVLILRNAYFRADRGIGVTVVKEDGSSFIMRAKLGEYLEVAERAGVI